MNEAKDLTEIFLPFASQFDLSFLGSPYKTSQSSSFPLGTSQEPLSCEQSSVSDNMSSSLVLSSPQTTRAWPIRYAHA